MRRWPIACARALVPELEPEDRPPNADSDEAWTKLVSAMPGLKERAKTVLDLLNNGRFVFVTRPLDIDDKASALLDADGRAVIQGLVEPFRPSTTGPLRASKRPFANMPRREISSSARSRNPCVQH